MAKILIVDDEPRIRELIHEHLQYAGYICEEAGCCHESGNYSKY